MSKLLDDATRRGRRWFNRVTAPAETMFGKADTRFERAAKGTFKAGLVLSSLAPALLFAFILFTPHLTALAQTPGGQLFGASDQTVGNGIRAFARWFRVFIFFIGVIALGACGVLKIFKQPWGHTLIGSAFCFGFAGIAQAVYTWSNGGEVEFNPDLGE